ncbi:hypothetical protein [Novipirellula caenicola]
MFHWLDGWITVRQIFRRLPSKKNRTPPAQLAMQESLYYAWKLGVSGILPSIVTGNNLLQAGKNAALFVKRTSGKSLSSEQGIQPFAGLLESEPTSAQS